MSTGRDDIGHRRALESDAEQCAAFEAALPDYLEGEMSPDADLTARAHLAACERCRMLVRDLDIIRARASALPALRPGRDLWGGIEARLRAVRPDRRVGNGRSSGWFAGWSAAPLARAAVLVIATAVVASSATWLLTRRQTVAVVRPVGTASPMIAANPGPVAPTGPTGGTLTDTVRVPRPKPAGGVLVSNEPAAPTHEFIYDQQIATLHQILEQRRGRLDPRTVAVIEKNLRVIDEAIAESKAALAKDPANAFLVQQLDEALDTKLELLRTVALLPSQT